jgi:hypothetical protein
MSDMRGFIGIDVGMFHDAFGRVGRSVNALRPHFLQRCRKKCGPRKIKIHVPAAGNFHALDSVNSGKLRRKLLCDLPRSALQPLCQLKAHGRGNFAHLDARRFLRDDADILLIVVADMRRERGANAGYKDVYQVSPICEEKQQL